MKNIPLFYILTASFLTIACSIQPEPINYGKDVCHYCKMAIVEKTHGAEIVTTKGKVFKYDAIECLLHDIDNRGGSKEIGLFLVTDYTKPETLIDATKATFLISEQVRSPMGANLSAFEQSSAADELQKNKTGKLFSWAEIQVEIPPKK